MHRLFRLRPSPALAVSIIALVLALGGVAWAAIPDGSGMIHGCYNTKGGQLSVIDTATGQTCGASQTALNFNQTGPPGRQGIQGVKGDQGIQGVKGDTGATGPSDSYMASQSETVITAGTQGPQEVLALTLPAGNYAINAKVTVGSLGSFEHVTCYLNLDGTQLDASFASITGSFATTTLPLASTGSLAAQGTANVTCQGGDEAFSANIVATKVGAIH
jgi:hypothetical protein